MKNVELTIGIPMYNAEKYIGRLLQCFKEEIVNISYEVLIVNDGSNDNSLIEAQKIQNQNIRILNKENGGVSSARNTIIKNAKGKWLTFVDADDLVDFKKLIETFNLVKKESYEYVICINNEDIYRKLLQLNYEKRIIYMIENSLINSPWQKFYLLDIIKNKKIQFDENISIGEDALFNFEYFVNINSYKIIYSDFYTYRQVNEESLSKKYKPGKFEELMEVNEKSYKLTSNIKLKKALECIRIKNSRGCLFEIENNRYIFSKYSDRYKYAKKIKRYKRIQFLYLNDLKGTILYYTWYLCPTIILPAFVTIKSKLKKERNNYES